ncbi:MFS transporter [Candidatus Bathyarchaeota archaeon]|nr:MFS transporter [Candidatus Bathyarchaeota archaeon]
MHKNQEKGLEDRKAYAAILLLGIVSLLGDIVYEGCRGLIPDYLRFLGATAFVVGFIGGLGEFIGYALRLASGFLADSTRAYWTFIFLGYGLIASIPLLGIAGMWEFAAILVILERLGKAIRSPSRDAVLSIVSKGVGAGKAFGLHELLDQTGAILGPLIVAALMLYSANNYAYTFIFLILPYATLMAFLTFTYIRLGKGGSHRFEDRKKEGFRSLGKPFYRYSMAVLLNTAGLLPVALILYRASTILQPGQLQWIIPLLYVLVQGVDAPIALLSGYAYDRFGSKVLVLSFILSILPTIFVSSEGLIALVAASLSFGLVLGMQESIYRAAVSELSPIASRGTAYGLFNMAYGIGFLISGTIYGAMIDLGLAFIASVLYVITIQGIALALLQSALRAELKPKGD